MNKYIIYKLENEDEIQIDLDESYNDLKYITLQYDEDGKLIKIENVEIFFKYVLLDKELKSIDNVEISEKVNKFISEIEQNEVKNLFNDLIEIVNN